MTSAMDTLLDDEDEGPPEIVVVDMETSSLDPRKGIALDVAWWNLRTNRRGGYICPHSWAEMVENADPESLRINNYLGRELWTMPHDQDGTDARGLYEQLGGNVMAGANPAFDWSFMRSALTRPIEREMIDDDLDGLLASHRFVDLSNRAAGRLGVSIEWVFELGAAKVAQALGFEPGGHTAWSDVTSEGQCFLRLDERDGAGVLLTPEELLGDRGHVEGGRLILAGRER